MTIPELFAPTVRPAHGTQSASSGTARTLRSAISIARANRMARELQPAGFAAGDRIAVYLANRPELIDLVSSPVPASVSIVRAGERAVPRARGGSHRRRRRAPRAVVAATGPVRPTGRWTCGGETTSPTRAAARPSGRWLTSRPRCGRRAVRADLHVGHHRAGEGGRADPRATSRPTRGLCAAWRVTERGPAAAGAPAVPRARAGQRPALLAGRRVAAAPAGALRPRQVAAVPGFRPTVFFGVPAMYVRLLDVETEAAREIGRRRGLFVSGSAPLPPAVFERSGAVRSRDPRAVRHDRDADDDRQPVRRRAPAGHGGPAAARCAGGIRDEDGREVPDGRHRGTPRPRCNGVRGVLAARRGHRPPRSPRTASSGPATWPPARQTGTSRCRAAAAT